MTNQLDTPEQILEAYVQAYISNEYAEGYIEIERTEKGLATAKAALDGYYLQLALEIVDKIPEGQWAQKAYRSGQEAERKRIRKALVNKFKENK